MGPSRAGLFLAAPDFPQRAAELLQLTEAQFETIRGLEPKREILLCRSFEKVVLRLTVDQETYWLATSSATESALRAQMVERYGLAGAVARLAAGQRPGDEPGVREVVA